MTSETKTMAPQPQNVTVPQAIQIGVKQHQAGRLHEAERTYRQVLKADPKNPDALHLLGVIAHQVGKNETSVELIAKAVAYRPSNPFFLNNLGEAYRALRRLGEALACFDKAIALKADYAEAHNNRGLVLQEFNRSDEALASYDRALKIRPDYANALNNRGLTLTALKRLDDALASYARALASKPDHIEAMSNRGNALKELNRLDEALASYAQAIAIKPDYALAHHNEALCRLLMGDFERGWAKNEWRWKWDEFPSARRNFRQPLWLGDKDIAGKTILLHAEQGLGDTLQFVRYAQAVAAKGAKVLLEVQPVLKPLLSKVAGVQQVLGQGEPLPAFDFHCPLLSLPLAFNTRLESIPAPISYLAAEKTAASAWRKQLAVKGKKLVGLCWKGSPIYKGDRERSVALSVLQPLLATPGVRFVSLQKELDAEEWAMTANLDNFVHPGADFKGTAEMVGALDLVISVDTAWAHWAGAIGKPVWVLLASVPHWCWLREREDSPWYPNARLYRQSRPGDWQDVMRSVKRDLPKIAGAKLKAPRAARLERRPARARRR